MIYQVYKDVVTVQGHGAIGLIQLGTTVLCFGDNGQKENNGANFELVLFAPGRLFHCKIRRGLTHAAPDEKPRTAKAVLSGKNVLSRLAGWISAFRR